MNISKILACAVLAISFSGTAATAVRADDAMMKKDEMKTGGMMKKDEMKNGGMMKKDNMMKKDSNSDAGATDKDNMNKNTTGQ